MTTPGEVERVLREHFRDLTESEFRERAARYSPELLDDLEPLTIEITWTNLKTREPRDIDRLRAEIEESLEAFHLHTRWRSAQEAAAAGTSPSPVRFVFVDPSDLNNVHVKHDTLGPRVTGGTRETRVYTIVVPESDTGATYFEWFVRGGERTQPKRTDATALARDIVEHLLPVAS